MSYSKTLFRGTRFFAPSSRPIAQNLSRNNVQSLRHYASARPVGGSSGGGLTNLQVALITGGISYVAAHAVYVSWTDHLASQSHSKTSVQQEEEVEAGSEEIEEVAEVSSPAEVEEVSSPEVETKEVVEVEVVQEISIPPESTAEESLPAETTPEDTSSTEQVQDPESSSSPEEPVPTITEASPTLETSEQAPTQEKEEGAKDVLIASNESVTIVAGAPVPRHPVCEESHSPLSLQSETKDVIMTQEPKADA